MASDPTVAAMIANMKSELEDIRRQAGKVNARRRHHIFPEDLVDNFVDDDGVIRTTLIVGPLEPSIDTQDPGKFVYYLLNNFQIVHYLVHNEEENSENGFRDEVEAIRNKFRGNTTVFGIPELPDSECTITDVPDEDIVVVGEALLHQWIGALAIESKDIVT